VYGLLPLGIRFERQAARFDGLDAAQLGIAQDDRRRLAARRPTHLAAKQAQLSAQIAFGGDAAAEIREGAQATVLVAQRVETLFELVWHGLGRV
jgi:hypothetical protein